MSSKQQVLLAVACALSTGACDWPAQAPNPQKSPTIGTAKFNITDADLDGMDDGWEVLHFGNLSRNGTGDYDSDGMLDVEEHTHNFNPTVNDALLDADGDRYPNVFELRNSGDPTDAMDEPTPTYVVNAGGGGNYTTIGAAVSAANTQNGTHQIIAVAPGLYTGTSNINVSFTSNKPKLLIIGTAGAVDTIIEGGSASSAWSVQNTVVLASLTMQHIATRSIWVNAASHRLRLVDMVFRNNAGTAYAGAIHISSVQRADIEGCTFLDNTTESASGQQIYLGSGAVNIVNTVVWSSGSGTMLYAHPTNVTLTTSYSLVKGQTLSGAGNLAGSTDPKIRLDGRVHWDSPLIAAGTGSAGSRLDMDLENRPTTSPDIGADQWIDADSDQLADVWETEQAGNLTTLTSRTQDADTDGLTNEEEYALATAATDADSDDDAVSDGDEVDTHGTDPLDADTDDDDMPDGWEVANNLNALVVNTFADEDGDRYPNIFEFESSTDPQDDQSIPTPDLIVDPALGAASGTDNIYERIAHAVTAATTANGAYQIIAVEPGTYAGPSNADVVVSANKPKLLIIGVDGAARTIVDGQGTGTGWTLNTTAVLASLTFRRTARAIYVSTTSGSVRLNDLLVVENHGTTNAGGLHVAQAVRLDVEGCTFLDNTATAASAQQIYIGTGIASIVNTVAWSISSGTTIYSHPTSVQLTTNYSLAKGQTLTGTGNISGATDPKLRFDGHLLWDSPLIGAGTGISESRLDMDLDDRPTSGADIGADEWVDTDADQVADFWEQEQTGSLTTLTSRTQDADNDGLTNEEEYQHATFATDSDSDDDTLADGDEVDVHETNPLSADTDADDMPDAWEVANNLEAAIADAFADTDGDRYPNVFEYAGTTNPQNSSSMPAADLVVDPLLGGSSGTDAIYENVSQALTAANVQNGGYQILEIEPGLYRGTGNTDLTLTPSKPTLLIIGVGGAANTIFDGDGLNPGWELQRTAVLASLTMRRFRGETLSVNAVGPVRLNDMVIIDNLGTASSPGGLRVYAAPTLDIVGSTFLRNISQSGQAHQIYVPSGQLNLVNTIIWGTSSGSMIYTHPTFAQLNATHSLVKGLTLAGTGNLAGNTDPLLRFDARLLPGSPLIAAGAGGARSRFDIDLDLRSATTPDIGADQWLDSDLDGLPDGWELAATGSLSLLNGLDSDGDGLFDLDEYEWFDSDSALDPLNPDTDGDLVLDGEEALHETNPLEPDAEAYTSDLNQDGLIDALGLQLGYSLTNLDDDGDNLSNADELLLGTDPLRADTDGDSVPDDTDLFPRDPTISGLTSNPSDVTGPVITLETPANATLL